ncbi:unnamed protein product [Effrenium voratum]|nr:unnamed protein product [Effrenium voratum]
MIALFALTLCLAGADEMIPEALDADDQCASPGCAVNALQLHVKGAPPSELSELSLKASQEWHSGYYGHAPRADISASNYKGLMANITVQQKAIMALWNRSVKLEGEVQVLVWRVQNDSGLKVQEYVALDQEAEMSTREISQGQQPREEHVKKWISYMDQEMGAVFRKLNSNGKLVAASGTLMSKNPVPLKLQNQKQTEVEALAQMDPNITMPGDHIGIGDELWRSVSETVTNIHTAQKSADNLEDHIQKINKMIVDFNEGKLIPNEDSGIGEHS